MLVFAPSGTTLAQMATAIGTRWTVEQCFEEGKGINLFLADGEAAFQDVFHAHMHVFP